MKLVHATAIMALAMSLAGCAGSISEPTAVQALSSDQVASLKISDITADAATGVEMSNSDFDAICEKVKAAIYQNAPGIVVATTDPAYASALKLKLHFTRFDRGNAFARAMLAGLGQIHIDATVELVDPSGKTVAQYDVSKDFSLGGVYGGSTTVEDVEDGFAKSVAEIVKAKT